MPRRLSLLALTLAMTLAGCSGYARRGEPVESQAPVQYGKGLAQDEQPGSGSSASKLATIRIRVVDPQGLPLAGALVNYRGPKKGKVATNAKGLATARVPGGTYDLRVAPCGTTVRTTTAGGADVQVAAGQTVDALIDGISWERRFHPMPSVRTSARPPWKIGQAVRVRIRIEDACDHQLAPKVALASYAWATDDTFELVRRPVMRADAEGFAPIDVRCAKRGNGAIVLYDRQIEDNRVDAIAAGTGPPAGRSWCE